MRGVRKATANGDGAAARTPRPHVSVWIDVDASRTMELVKRLKASADFADVKVSPLLIMARAVIWAVRRTPMVNAAWVDTDDGAQIRLRHYVNLGIAAATPRGPARAEHQGRAGPQHARTRPGAREAHAHRARGQDHTGRPAGRHDHDHQHRRLRRRRGHPDHQPGRSRASSLSARSGRSRGSSTARCARAGSRPCRDRSTTAWSTATASRASSPTSPRCSRSPRCCSTEPRPPASDGRSGLRTIIR